MLAAWSTSDYWTISSSAMAKWSAWQSGGWSETREKSGLAKGLRHGDGKETWSFLRAKKTGRSPGFSVPVMQRLRSLDLGFLVHHVLAHNWIVLLELQLLRCVLLVLVCRVVVPGSCRRNQFDLVASAASHGGSP